MAQTERLYDRDAYLWRFEARISEVRPAEIPEGAQDTCSPAEGWRAYSVVTERTAFFPEGGGQTSDRGTLAGFPVADVQLREDGAVAHTVLVKCQRPDNAPDASGGSAEIPQMLAEGRTVTGEVDGARRFSNMQNHTGEHILSGLMHTRYGFDNIGFHLSDNSVTLDVNGHLTDEQIRELETAANEVVWRNVPVTARYPDEQELASLTYRSKKEIDGPLRVVTVEGVDNCACCAPHVARTGEIGLIRIMRVIRYNGGMRLNILCGRRALEAVQAIQAQAEEISHLVSSPQEQIAGAVQRLLKEIEAGRTRERSLEDRIAQIHLESSGDGNVWIFEKYLSLLPQRALVNSLCDRLAESGGGICGVYAGDEESGYMYIAGGRGADARRVSAAMREQFGGKGGGRPEMVQGSVHAPREEILRVLREL